MKSNFVKLGVVALVLFSASDLLAQNKARKTPEEMFSEIDVNNDGLIALEEFKNKKHKQEVSDEETAIRFAKLDLDSNGSLTLEEFKARSKKKKKGMKKGKNKK